MSIYVTRGHSGRWAVVDFPPHDGIQRKFENIETALWWIEEKELKRHAKENAAETLWLLMGGFVAAALVGMAL